MLFLATVNKLNEISFNRDNPTFNIEKLAGEYLKVKDKTNNQLSEQWVNPRDIPLSGMLKTLADSQMGKVTVELTSFKM